jgi:P-type conjugative transfer protein TrbG
MRVAIITLGALVAMSALAQQAPTQKQFAEAANILRTGNTAPAPAAAPARHKAKASTPKVSAQADYTGLVLKREVPLTSTAKLGLALAEQIETSATPPTISNDGRVIFTYGHSFATVVCATFEICEIDLEAGETITKDSIDIGDNRFQVVARTAGSGSAQYPYLIIKPTQPGLDTSLSVGTNRRAYYLRLISTDHQLMPRSGFVYPDDEVRRAAEAKAAEEAHKAESDREKEEAERIEHMGDSKPPRNWNYSVKLHGKDAGYLNPLSIADDGIQTRIELSDEARHRGLPVVVISDARGAIPANVHWQNNTLIVDAIFQHACLLEGVGRKQQRACIENGGLQK